VVVHAANVQDAEGAWDLLKRLKLLYCWLRVIFADSSYNRLAVLLACFLLGLRLIVVHRITGMPGFIVLPRRWVVLPCTILPGSASSGQPWSLASI
jgi:putative transposase